MKSTAQFFGPAFVAALLISLLCACTQTVFAQQNASAVILVIRDTDGALVQANGNGPNGQDGEGPNFIKQISGLQPGEQIISIDFRPKTGELYGVSTQSRVYVIDYRQVFSSPAVATPVGAINPATNASAPFSPALNYTSKVDIDFNPVSDRIRVVTDNDQNLRLNPDTGQVSDVDAALAYAAGDANAGQNPNIVGAGYTNSFNGATTTTLFDIDSTRNIFATQNPPNSGTLNTSFALPVDTTEMVGFDVAADGASGGGTAWASLRRTTDATARLYSINLTTGASFDRGPFGFIPRSLAVQLAPQRTLIISEFRFSSPNGANDEFVELYNNTDRDITVRSTDSFRTFEPQGWLVRIVDPQAVFTDILIPNGTVIPARTHFLIANDTPNTGYSLNNVATPDLTYRNGVSDNSSIALYQSAFETGGRLDAAGFDTQFAFAHREGAGIPAGGAETTGVLNYSFYRDLSTGLPKDTDDNAADFIAVNTSGVTTPTGAQHRLGAPGPENSASHLQRNAQVNASSLDPQRASTVAPNRVRDRNAVGPNATQGTIIIRRVFTNNTGAPITALRFRVVTITTLNSPGYTPLGAQADLRALTSADTSVTRADGVTVQVRGTTLDETPAPAQPNGGGYNSTLSVALPQPLANGASVNVQFVLGVVQGGSFNFFVNVEALPN